jgi:hypothetical protein
MIWMSTDLKCLIKNNVKLSVIGLSLMLWLPRVLSYSLPMVLRSKLILSYIILSFSPLKCLRAPHRLTTPQFSVDIVSLPPTYNPTITLSPSYFNTVLTNHLDFLVFMPSWRNCLPDVYAFTFSGRPWLQEPPCSQGQLLPL